MKMLRAGGLLDVLTPLSDCRQESVGRMERICLGVSYLYLICATGLCVVGFVCSVNFSLSFPATTPRTSTPRRYTQGYHAVTTTALLSRLCMHPGYHAIVYIYSQVITPKLSRSTTHVHRLITPAIDSSLHFTFHRFLHHLFFSSTPPPGCHTYQPTPQDSCLFSIDELPTKHLVAECSQELTTPSYYVVVFLL